MIMGKSLIKNPYVSHNKTPVIKIIYIPKEISFVCLVLIVFIVCGKKETVVKAAAISPTTVTQFIINGFLWGL